MEAAMTMREDTAETGRLGARVGAALARLWHGDPVLVITGVALLAALVPFVAGIFLDPRQITGAPAWLKPAKFAISTAIYSLTLAWVFSYLSDWPRTRRIVGRTTAFVLVLEVVIIAVQAARGTTSHFNVGTPLDAGLFAVMGTAIVVQTLTSIAVAVALWRTRFADRAMGWALRFGMTLTICGAFTGGLMTTGPTDAQLAAAQVTGHLAIAGAHTVGGPDGGPGLPITGWSTRHGDVRVPHFVGLHAVQALPLAVLLMRRRREPTYAPSALRRTESTRTRWTIGFAIVYAVVFIGLTVQALLGAPLLPLAR
jgi:hypothetical protein